jgi:uncharacterized DUF497 family protein
MHTVCIYWLMDIEFDPDKAKSNLRKHGVSFAHAEDALQDPMALTIEDPVRSANRGSSRWLWTAWAAFS